MEKLVTEAELAKLPIEILYVQKQTLDRDVEFLQESLNTLKGAQEKFEGSRKNVEKVMESRTARKLENSLVPLTESMFVRGEILNNDRFLVNIGTGYYLRMSGERAAAYFKRRHDYVAQQIGMVQSIFNEKELTRNVMAVILQEKIKQLKSRENNADDRMQFAASVLTASDVNLVLRQDDGMSFNPNLNIEDILTS